MSATPRLVLQIGCTAGMNLLNQFVQCHKQPWMTSNSCNSNTTWDTCYFFCQFWGLSLPDCALVSFPVLWMINLRPSIEADSAISTGDGSAMNTRMIQPHPHIQPNFSPLSIKLHAFQPCLLSSLVHLENAAPKASNILANQPERL